MAFTDRFTDKQAQDFANQVGTFFRSAPHLPKNWVVILVKITPVLTMIGAVLSILAALSAFSFIRFAGIGAIVSAVAAALSGILLFQAYKPLQEHRYDGWMLLFAAQLVSIAGGVVNAFFAPANLVGTLIGAVIGMYILFEMRSSYGAKGKVESLKTDLKKISE